MRKVKMKRILLILFLISFKLISQTSDCPAYNLCSTSNFNYTPTNSGVSELNSSNQGCLSVEHKSVWLQITIFSNGILYFRIKPTINSDDFDFAVWLSSNCPPTNQPVRCSFSATSGNTGLGNGATDNSESAFGDKWVAPLNVSIGETYIIMIDNYSVNSGFTLNWNYNAGGNSYNTTATFSCPTPLPIELKIFTGTSIREGNKICWSTVTENNNDYFVIEKSKDAISFETLGIEIGAGNSSTLLNYSLIDTNPYELTYYRLKQVDYDGKETYSNIIVVNKNKKELKIVKITNILGQEVGDDYEGLKVIQYSDGSVIKKLGK